MMLTVAKKICERPLSRRILNVAATFTYNMWADLRKGVTPALCGECNMSSPTISATALHKYDGYDITSPVSALSPASSLVFSHVLPFILVLVSYMNPCLPCHPCLCLLHVPCSPFILVIVSYILEHSPQLYEHSRTFSTIVEYLPSLFCKLPPYVMRSFLPDDCFCMKLWVCRKNKALFHSLSVLY